MKKTLRSTIGTLGVLVVIGALFDAPATAATVSCGDVITVDTTLDADLACPGDGLAIGADGVRLDLGGHTLSSTDGLGYGIDLTGGNDGVRIENGEIAGFMEGIRGEEVDGLRLENLVIRDLSGEGLIEGFISVVGAVHLKGGSDFVMEDSQLLIGLPERIDGALAADGVILESIDGARIENCVIRDAVVGVEFASCGELLECPLPEDQPPSNGSVKGCTIEAHTYGVLLWNSTDALIEDNSISGASRDGIRIGFRDWEISNARIKNNEIFDCATGVRVAVTSLNVTDALIEDNDIHDNGFGLIAFRLRDSRVAGNRMNDSGAAGMLIRSASTGNEIVENDFSNNGVRGLVLLFGADDNLIAENTLQRNGSDGIALFLGTNTGNVLRDNRAWNNGGWDMFHNGASTANTWVDNRCKSSSGADIDCP